MFLRMRILCRTTWRRSRRGSPAIFHPSTCDSEFPVCLWNPRTDFIRYLNFLFDMINWTYFCDLLFESRKSCKSKSKISFSSNICSTTLKRLHMISSKSVCSRIVLASFMFFVTTVRCLPRFARRRSNFSFSSPMITNETTQCNDDKWKRLKRMQNSAPRWAPCYEQKKWKIYCLVTRDYTRALSSRVPV